MTIQETIHNGIDSLLDAVYQINLYKQKKKSNKIYVKLITDNRNIETHPALLSEDRQFVVVESLKRTFYHPVIYQENGRQIIYIAENTIGNFDHEIIKKVAQAQKYKVFAKWKHYRKWITTKVFLAEGSIDWNLLSETQGWSINFSSTTNQVIAAKNLSFLNEMGNTKFLLSLLAAWLFGVCIGGFFGGIILGVMT